MRAMWNKRTAVAAAIILLLASASCTGEDDQASTGSGASGQEETAPEVPAAPPPADPPEPPASQPCPNPSWPINHPYGGTATRIYQLDADYSDFYAGFNLCSSADQNSWVLVNNTNQVWSFDPGLSVSPVGTPRTETDFFRSGVESATLRGFAAPREVVTLSEWPTGIAWGPDLDLTSKWLAQTVALGQFVSIKDGETLQDAIGRTIWEKRLKQRSPQARSIYDCVNSGLDAEKAIIEAQEARDAMQRLNAGMKGTMAGRSCRVMLKILHESPAEAGKTGQTVDQILSHSSTGLDAIGSFLTHCGARLIKMRC